VEKEGCQAEVIDCRAIKWAKAHIREKADRADLVVLTSSPLDRWQCPNLELAPVLEAAWLLPQDRLFVTGVQGTLFPEEMLSLTQAKGIIRGQPEETVRDLAQGRAFAQVPGLTWQDQGQAVSNPDRPPLNPADLPLPAYHLLDLAGYAYELLGHRLGLVETARGCPFACAFCLKAMYPGRLRAKPTSQVLEEVEALVRGHRAQCLYFIDLEFAARRQAVEELCRGLIERRLTRPWSCQTRLDSVDRDLLDLMSRAGCRLIHFGVETADSRALKKAAKPIDLRAAARTFDQARQAGLQTAAFFLLGLPGQDQRQARQTLALARRLKPTFASFHVMTPYPGTAWGAPASSWQAWAEAARSREEAWSAACRRAYLGFYLRPGYFLAGLKGPGRLPWARGFKLWRSFVR